MGDVDYSLMLSKFAETIRSTPSHEFFAKAAALREQADRLEQFGNMALELEMRRSLESK